MSRYIAKLERYGTRATVKSFILSEALRLLRYLFSHDKDILKTQDPPGRWNIIFWARYGWAAYDRVDHFNEFERLVRELLEQARDDS